MASFTESVVENAALAWLESLGYAIQHLPAPQNDTTRQAGGPEIAPGELLSKPIDCGYGASALIASVSAKNATVER